jgi:hypothetical protein
MTHEIGGIPGAPLLCRERRPVCVCGRFLFSTSRRKSTHAAAMLNHDDHTSGKVMKQIRWKDTAELIGIFSILASLIFVALQLDKEEELLELEMRNYMVASAVAVNAQIIENADIWVRGNAGADLNQTELTTYELLLTSVNDQAFHTTGIFNKIEPEYVEQILSMYAGFLSENPGAYQTWIKRENRLNAYRTAVDPSETITTEWIDTIESRMQQIAHEGERARQN